MSQQFASTRAEPPTPGVWGARATYPESQGKRKYADDMVDETDSRMMFKRSRLASSSPPSSSFSSSSSSAAAAEALEAHEHTTPCYETKSWSHQLARVPYHASQMPLRDVLDRYATLADLIGKTQQRLGRNCFGWDDLPSRTMPSGPSTTFSSSSSFSSSFSSPSSTAVRVGMKKPYVYVPSHIARLPMCEVLELCPGFSETIARAQALHGQNFCGWFGAQSFGGHRSAAAAAHHEGAQQGEVDDEDEDDESESQSDEESGAENWQDFLPAAKSEKGKEEAAAPRPSVTPYEVSPSKHMRDLRRLELWKAEEAVRKA
ncbi:hypothetical protein F4778DRAFT_717515 [Xylariomycetidae sp. FL2044]|nr:hypothetical protein F4778DRAFT_717515 [Xylariomycetidae sp. FL2044]